MIGSSARNHLNNTESNPKISTFIRQEVNNKHPTQMYKDQINSKTQLGQNEAESDVQILTPKVLHVHMYVLKMSQIFFFNLDCVTSLDNFFRKFQIN